MRKKAFTIIEFMLATTILTVMLISIAALTIRIIEIYKKGLAMRAVNSVGRDIVSDLSRVIASSPVTNKVMPEPGADAITDTAIKKSWADYYNELTVDRNGFSVQASGVFCTGQYSYIWNTAPTIESINDGVTPTTALKINDQVHRLARIPDGNRSVCNHGTGAALIPPAGNNYTADDKDVTVLINKDENDLVLYDFSILPAMQNRRTSQIFYSGSFIIATLAGGVNVQSNGNFCTGKDKTYTSEEDTEATSLDFNYCSVNKFNFSVRATGRNIEE